MTSTYSQLIFNSKQKKVLYMPLRCNSKQSIYWYVLTKKKKVPFHFTVLHISCLVDPLSATGRRTKALPQALACPCQHHLYRWIHNHRNNIQFIGSLLYFGVYMFCYSKWKHVQLTLWWPKPIKHQKYPWFIDRRTYWTGSSIERVILVHTHPIISRTSVVHLQNIKQKEHKGSSANPLLDSTIISLACFKKSYI